MKQTNGIEGRQNSIIIVGDFNTHSQEQIEQVGKR